MSALHRENSLCPKLAASVFLALLLSTSHACAAEGKVTFVSPANGAFVGVNDNVMVTYEAVLGPKGDHMHLYLDGKKKAVLRQSKGSAELGALSPGAHHICISINTSWHFSTGVEECIDVIAQ